jgi:hypothetical protein
MLLRSGKIYDPEYPSYLKNFRRLDNPLFRSIWDKSAKIYNDYMENDFLNETKAKKARLLFKKYMEDEIQKVYIQSKSH